ncbi:MarR family transcriptional regulator [Methylorubrum populi]
MGADYVAAVLYDVDPLLIDEILTLLNRRGLAWVRRSRGSVWVFGVRPENIAIPRDGVAEASGALCQAIAGHMLALARTEVASRQASENGDQEGSGRLADEGRVHCSRIVPIVRSHAAKGLALADIRSAMHDAFSPAAMEALTRYEARLAPEAVADALDEPQRAPKAKRLPAGLSLTEKAFEHIAAAGPAGATRTRLMDAIRPKPDAEAVTAVLAALTADGRVTEREVRSGGRGRPAPRYFAAPIGLPHAQVRLAAE